jgi:hypothetical protein
MPDFLVAISWLGFHLAIWRSVGGDVIVGPWCDICDISTARMRIRGSSVGSIKIRATRDETRGLLEE